MINGVEKRTIWVSERGRGNRDAKEKEEKREGGRLSRE